MFKRKVKVLYPLKWSHHRMGWGCIVDRLMAEFHTDNGVELYTNGIVPILIDNYKKVQTSPWVAFMHITPSDTNLEKNLTNNKAWHESLHSCRGMYALSEYSKAFLTKFVGQVTVETLLHPIQSSTVPFSWGKFSENRDKKVYFLGNWRRRTDDFYKLRSPYSKVLVHCTGKKPKSTSDVQVVDYLLPYEYDRLFENNIVFLSLEDASANNTVLECIHSSTPLIVNKHPAVEEYLGPKYPLFYTTITDVDELFRNDKISEGHEYLKQMDKSHLTIDSFVKSFANSSIYQKLPAIGKVFL